MVWLVSSADRIGMDVGLTRWSGGSLFHLVVFGRVCCWRGRRLGRGIELLGCLGCRRRGFLR